MGRVCAIILAAGAGSRMGTTLTKQKINILGRSVLFYALYAFNACADVDDIVVVARRGEEDFARAQSQGMDKVREIVVGGESRAESASFGFAAIPQDAELVAIHDSARALITPQAISAVIKEAERSGAASAVSQVTDTVKLVGKDGEILKTIDRSTLRKAETPQAFSVALYNAALSAVTMGADITDDNMLLERAGVRVSTVDVGRENIKITTQEDLKYAELILAGRGWKDA